MNHNIKIDPYGFREYDARWLYEKDINKEGIANLGKVQEHKSYNMQIIKTQELQLGMTIDLIVKRLNQL